jgi:hypothetical protein
LTTPARKTIAAMTAAVSEVRDNRFGEIAVRDIEDELSRSRW